MPTADAAWREQESAHAVGAASLRSAHTNERASQTVLAVEAVRAAFFGGLDRLAIVYLVIWNVAMLLVLPVALSTAQYLKVPYSSTSDES